jgi:hypothetical protein
MLTKAILAVAIIFVTASGALATTKSQSAPSQNVHNPAGAAVDDYPHVLDCVHVTFPQCSGGI